MILEAQSAPTGQGGSGQQQHRGSTVVELQAAASAAQARLDRAEQRLEDRQVRAPFTGIVGIRGSIRLQGRQRHGDHHSRRQEPDDRRVLAAETFYGRVQRGLVIEARSAGLPGRTFDGRVTSIDTRVDVTSRSFRVRASLPNPTCSCPQGSSSWSTSRLASARPWSCRRRRSSSRPAAVRLSRGRGARRAARRHPRHAQQRHGRDRERRGAGRAGRDPGPAADAATASSPAMICRRTGGRGADRRFAGTGVTLSELRPPPVLATVASLLIVVFGIASLMQLPVRDCPMSTTGWSACPRPITVPHPRSSIPTHEVIEGAVAWVAGYASQPGIRRGRAGRRSPSTPTANIDEAANDVRDAVARVRTTCRRTPTSRRSSRATATPTR
jgi:hypothetical protein